MLICLGNRDLNIVDVSETKLIHLKQYSITIKANKILLVSIQGELCVLRGLPKPFICNLPWRVVGNGLVYSGVIDGVELVGLVVDDDVVVEPMAPQYLVGHVRRSNL